MGRGYARLLIREPQIALSMIRTGVNRLMHCGFEQGIEFEADARAVCRGLTEFRTAVIA